MAHFAELDGGTEPEEKEPVAAEPALNKHDVVKMEEEEDDDLPF